jgi:hypothetical protein
MAGEDVKYTISAQDVSGAAIDSAIANQERLTNSTFAMESKTASVLGNIQKHWMGYSATVYAAYQVINKGWDLAKAGADFAEQQGLLDNLGRKFNATSESIVNSMRTASDGLVADADLMSVALGGLAKGLKPEQLTNLADAARILGDAAGRDATTALRELTEALETGRTKSLQPFLGTTLDLKTTFGELESKLTLTEKAQAMYNLTMITATKLQAEQTKTVDDAADRIERLEAKWKNLKTTVSLAAKSLLMSFLDADAWKAGAFAMMGMDMPEMPGEAGPTPVETDEKKKEADRTAAIYQGQIDSLKKLLQARKDNEGAAKKEDDRQKQAAKDLLASIQAQMDADDELYRSIAENTEKGLKEKAELQKKFAEEGMRAGEAAMRWELETRKTTDDLIVKSVEERERAIQLILTYSLDRQKQQYDEYWAGVFDMANNSGDMSQGMGMFAANAKGIADIYSGKDKYTEEENRAYEHYMSLKELYWYDYENRVEVANAYRDYETMIDENQMNRRVQIASSGFGMMSGLAQAFYDASGQQNEAAFKAYQAFAIAKAVIDTYKAAAAAWSAGWDSGVTAYDKAALAAAMMALAIGTGLAQVAMIASARPGSSSAGSVGGGSAGGYSYVQPTEGSWQKTETPTRAAPVVNINIYGDVLNNHDELARKIVEPLQKAWEDGAH